MLPIFLSLWAEQAFKARTENCAHLLQLLWYILHSCFEQKFKLKTLNCIVNTSASFPSYFSCFKGAITLKPKPLISFAEWYPWTSTQTNLLSEVMESRILSPQNSFWYCVIHNHFNVTELRWGGRGNDPFHPHSYLEWKFTIWGNLRFLSMLKGKSNIPFPGRGEKLQSF